MSTDRRMIKEEVYMYIRILLGHKKNKFESILVKWMNLEPLQWSVRKRKRADQVPYTWKSKNDIDEPCSREGMEMQI